MTSQNWEWILLPWLILWCCSFSLCLEIETGDGILRDNSVKNDNASIYSPNLPYEDFNSLSPSANDKVASSNKLWLTCSNDVIISKKREKSTEVAWHSIPKSCQLQEIGLLFICIIVTLMTIVGNAFMLIILIASGLLKARTFMIHTSMAVNDLLLGLMPLSLAVYSQFALMAGSLTLDDLARTEASKRFETLLIREASGFPGLIFERSGYPVFCSILMNISIYVSLLSLALYSIERLTVVMRQPIPGAQLIYAICFTWVSGIGFSLLIHWTENGWSSAVYFDPITRLTLNLPSRETSVSIAFFYLQIAVAAIAGLITVILTLAAIILTWHNDRWSYKFIPMILKFLLMLISFLVTYLPLLFHIAVGFNHSNPVTHFFAWWLCMAGASWNWALYSLSGKRFREAAIKVLYIPRIRQMKQPFVHGKLEAWTVL